MNATLATATATTATTTTTTDRIGPRPADFRQRPQQTRKQPATTSTSIRISRHHDIRNYLSITTAAGTSTHAMQAATEEPITPTDNIFSRNRFQQPRTQETQATTEEPTIFTVRTFPRLRVLRNRL
jgi:hypothetical protein